MEKIDEPRNPEIPGNEAPEVLLGEMNSDDSTMVTQSLAVAQRAPLPWIGAMPRSSYGVMAVVNEDGYLVPVWTAGDLLRACKIIWQATKD